MGLLFTVGLGAFCASLVSIAGIWDTGTLSTAKRDIKRRYRGTFKGNEGKILEKLKGIRVN